MQRTEAGYVTERIILHAHFDHCGLVPFMKRRWPWVSVAASARAKELLSDPAVSERVGALNPEP